MRYKQFDFDLVETIAEIVMTYRIGDRNISGETWNEGRIPQAVLDVYEEKIPAPIRERVSELMEEHMKDSMFEASLKGEL